MVKNKKIPGSIYCVVEVWTDKQETCEQDYLVNFSNFATKRWLEKLMVWALMSDRELSIRTATNDDMNAMKMFMP